MLSTNFLKHRWYGVYKTFKLVIGVVKMKDIQIRIR